ncbi:hypothetical protein [Nocardioides daphniae]|uniref:Copper chaperone PCu(A)C n=1 Tax=Nocardioides daphniae TaxID=402297 RepID=A0A4P7UC22_9ACTN|nr:hypothetical protein [Nocardioides daphniae]QCC76519.1 hypothetical protein E2C04_03540 [Nocardioides daphniae]GGD05883.1 hypothetical protein GCM10007231_00760 [Nocardioides daphniae]
MQKPSRRTTALASIALVLAPVLSSCGFDYATDRDYTPGVGANSREATVDVLAGVVVTDGESKAVMVASFANNSTEETVSVTGVTAEGAQVADVAEIELAPQGFHSLATSDSPIVVTGDVEAGTFLPVTIAFSNGESTDMKLPVVNNCGPYAEVAGLDRGLERCESGNDHSEGGH